MWNWSAFLFASGFVCLALGLALLVFAYLYFDKAAQELDEMQRHLDAYRRKQGK